MYYDLITDLVSLVKEYEKDAVNNIPDILAFGNWLHVRYADKLKPGTAELVWSGKEYGRSADSVINTSLVHLYRYAKLHAKTAIIGTGFSTPDDFIYLISLVSFGSMTKTALIRLNVHEKSAGMQIVNRLIANGLVDQEAMATDKRNRIIHITAKGTALLNDSMPHIRTASNKVTAPLSADEKIELIRLLAKLENFHEQTLKGAL